MKGIRRLSAENGLVARNTNKDAGLWCHSKPKSAEQCAVYG